MDRHTCELSLSDGTPIRVRPIVPSDKDHLTAGMRRMSEDSRHFRFMGGLSELSSQQLRYFTEIDYVNHFALGALALDRDPPLGIAVARYVRDPAKPHVAEPAISVIDAYQHRGLGSLLLDQLMTVALAHDITHFRATLLADNEPMKQLFMRQGAAFEYQGSGVVAAEFALPKSHRPRVELIYELARHAYSGAVKSAREALP